MPSRLATRDSVQDSATKSKAKADALTLRSIAGRLRVAWELATGAQVVAGDGYAIERNPSGDYGCNGSGPPWGAAYWSPFMGKGGITPDTTNWIGQKRAMPDLVADAASEVKTRDIPLRFWVQGYEIAAIQGVTVPPLARLYPVIVMRTLSAGTVSVTVTARSAGYVERSATFSVAGTSEQTFQDDGLWIDTQPGTVVPARLIFSLDDTIGVSVVRVSLNNKRVRGHGT